MIDELGMQLSNAWQSTSGIEIGAAVLAVLYLLLAIKQHKACWAAAFVSSCLYAWVLFAARLYMESILNCFYAAMAAYGYWQWTGRDTDGALAVTRWPLSRSLQGLAGVLLLSLVSSFFLRRLTPAAWPFVDSMVTWASVFATFLVARKVFENWHWWLIIDSVSLGLYVNRRLYLTAWLFGAYLLLIFAGMRAWRHAARSAPDGAQPA